MLRSLRRGSYLLLLETWISFSLRGHGAAAHTRGQPSAAARLSGSASPGQERANRSPVPNKNKLRSKLTPLENQVIFLTGKSRCFSWANLKDLLKAVFFSGLVQITCSNGHLKPDFLFQVPGGGEGRRGSVEVRGMGGRRAGRRGLKKMGKKRKRKM